MQLTVRSTKYFCRKVQSTFQSTFQGTAQAVGRGRGVSGHVACPCWVLARLGSRGWGLFLGGLMGKGWPPLMSLAPCKAPGTSLGKSRGLRSPGLVRRCDRAVCVGGGWAWELLHVTPGVVHGWGRARARGCATCVLILIFLLDLHGVEADAPSRRVRLTLGRSSGTV